MPVMESANEPTPTPTPRRGEDPGPEGPVGEPVGDDEGGGDDAPSESKPSLPPGSLSPVPGLPMVPEHGSPDADPIDPRVF